MAQLIDTSVLIAIERAGIPPASLADLLPGSALAIAAITASELIVGVHLADTSGRRREREQIVETVLALVPTIPFDLATARIHAGLTPDLRKVGVKVAAHDLLIAATALLGGHEVVTANLRDFGRIPSLSVRRFDLGAA